VLEPLFAGLDRSVLLRVQTVRALSLWLRGRIALRLGAADVQRTVARTVAELARIANPRAGVVAALLDAGAAARRRDVDTAVARLRLAIERATATDLALHATAARRQLGTLLGGSEAPATSPRPMRTSRAKAIVSPARFADWFVPL